jgi:glutamine cyclotransferase
VRTYQPRVLDSIPHDTTAFTQGLVLHNGKLYESTGKYGHSSVRVLDTATGSIDTCLWLDNAVFAEGLAVMDDHAVQLTWKAGMAFQYRISDWSVVDTFFYRGQGWGLCRYGDRFLMSDGSSVLTVRDATFGVRESLQVRYLDNPLEDINELEYIGNSLWANVWHSDYIFIISLYDTARVTGTVDCSALALRMAGRDGEDVLNGIAYDAGRDRVFITGKNWPWIFIVAID